jgi:hypothetical protein
MILAIDPGNEESAFVEYATGVGRPHAFGKWRNEDLLNLDIFRYGVQAGSHLAIEMIASYGMPVGAEVFQTCVWIGRFIQAWGGPYTLVYRHEVKMNLCYRTAKVDDAVIRQALIDRFGPGKEKAIGKKKTPGPLYGVKADVWSALAVAVTYADGAARKAA